MKRAEVDPGAPAKEPGQPAGGFGKARAVFAPNTIFVITFALIALWIATRPFEGIVDDARLYMVQALNLLDPASFADDLFFKYGSQDKFSVFSLLYAPVVWLLGPGGAHLLLWSIGQTFWLLALLVLARTLFPAPGAAVGAVVGAIILVPNYGWGVLQYGEPFVTPRVFVEAMSLVSIACALRNRPVLAFVMGVAAALVHPLMALPALTVVGLLTLPFLRVFLPMTAIVLLAFAGAAMAHIDPFTRMLETMDREWLEIVRDRSPHAFVEEWIVRGSILAALPLVSLGFIFWQGETAHRRLAGATLAMGAVFVSISWIGGDRFANVLFLNLQLWRGLWLVTLLGNLFIFSVILMLPSEARGRPILIAATVIYALEAHLRTTPVAGALVLLVGIALIAFERRQSGKVLRFVNLFGTAILAVATLLLVAEASVSFKFLDARLSENVPARLVVILFAAYLLILWPRRRSQHTGFAVVASIAVLAGSLALSDARSELAKYYGSPKPPEPVILQRVSGKSTYWENGMEILWFKMRQPSYYAFDQGAGVMFYRDTALEYHRRGVVLRALNTVDFEKKSDQRRLQRANPLAEGPNTRAQIVDACVALPDLDVMVLRADVPDVPHTTWQPGFPVPASGFVRDNLGASDPAAAGGASDGLFHIYDCDDIRRHEK